MFSGQGLGTVESPYEITSLAQLAEMADDVTANYKLMNDIDASLTSDPAYNEGKGWVPIKGEFTGFTGILDGNFKTIFNLFINNSLLNNLGLFASIEGGEVTRLKMSLATIIGHTNVGIIAGFADDSSLHSIFTSGIVSGISKLGGIVGDSSLSTFSFCVSYANVTSLHETEASNIAGLVGGLLNGTVNDSFYGGLLGPEAKFVAGLVGPIAVTAGVDNITKSYYDGTINPYLFSGNGSQGISITTEQIDDSSNFVDWDFETTWTNTPYMTLQSFLEEDDIPDDPIDPDDPDEPKVPKCLVGYKHKLNRRQTIMKKLRSGGSFIFK